MAHEERKEFATRMKALTEEEIQLALMVIPHKYIIAELERRMTHQQNMLKGISNILNGNE